MVLHLDYGRLVFLYSRRLPEDGNPVPKHVAVWHLVMSYILLSAFVGFYIIEG